MVSRPHNFPSSADNSLQHYCGGAPLLRQDPAIERCNLVQRDKGNSCQGGSEIDVDKNSRGKHCDNWQQHLDERTLHQLFGRRTSTRNTLKQSRSRKKMFRKSINTPVSFFEFIAFSSG